MAFTRVPLKRAATAGGLAFLASYALVFVAYLGRVRALLESVAFTPYGTASTSLTANMGESIPAYWKLAGWVLYNANLVSINVPPYPGAARVKEVNLITGTGGAHLLVLAVPALALILAGYIAARDVRSTVGGHIYTGMAIFTGYLPMTVLGFFVFSFRYQYTDGGLAVQLSPNPLSGLLLMGVLLPIVFGAIGGFVAEHRQSLQDREHGADNESSTWG